MTKPYPVLFMDTFNGAGYIADGDQSVPSSVTLANVDRLSFVSETCAQISYTLSAARETLAGSNSTTVAYFWSGFNFPGGPGIGAYIDGMNFASETSAYIAAAVDYRYCGSGASSASYGYSAGGLSDTGGLQTIISNIQFGTNTQGRISGVLSPMRAYVGGNVYSTTHMYFGGGSTTLSDHSAVIDGFRFDTGANLGLGISLATARTWVAGVHSTTHGYFCGGATGYAASTEITAITFSDDTAATAGFALGTGTQQMMGTCSVTRGYLCGGVPGLSGTAPVATTQVITYAPSAAMGTTSATLSAARGLGCGVQWGAMQ